MPHPTQNSRLNGILDRCEICGIYARLQCYWWNEVVCGDCREMLHQEHSLKVLTRKTVNAVVVERLLARIAGVSNSS